MSGDDLHTLAGPALLLAGPGTGKTYRLGRRIKYLVEELHVSPEELTVITFTAAAAANMRDRISDEATPELFLPYLSQPNRICTIHSLGFRIIRENAGRVGLHEPVRVLSDDPLRAVLMGDAAQICQCPRSAGLEPAACRQAGDCSRDDSAKCRICGAYRSILTSCNAIDYDDQILLACALLNEDVELLAKYRKGCTHLLVDEYQDINGAQHALIRLLSGGNPAGLFVVGDDDQSIYSWRGGSPTFIRSFRDHFGAEATIRPLHESRRCHRHVLESATAIVRAFDPARLDKGTFEYKTENGPKLQVHSAPSDVKEARLVRKIVQRVLGSQDVLILVPYRRFAQALTTELRTHQIGFTAPPIAPGAGLPLIATLAQWLGDNAEGLSLRACIEAFIDSPASGVPSSRVRQKNKRDARENATAVVAALWEPVISGSAKSLWEVLRSRTSEHPLIQGIYESLTRLLQYYEAGNELAQFLAVTASDLAPWRRVSDCLSEVNAWVECAAQLGRGGASESNVRIMTFQGAKGLEASVVIILGLEEG